MARRAACVALLCIALIGAAYASQQQYGHGGPGYEHSGPDDHHGPDSYEHHGERDGYGPGPREGDSYGHEPHYEHQSDDYYKALKLTLQEEKVVNAPVSVWIDTTVWAWTSVFKCPTEEKTQPEQCLYQPDPSNPGYGYHDKYDNGDDDDFITKLTEGPAAQCTFVVVDMDSNGDTNLQFTYRVDVTCTILASAEKCGYGLPLGATFNATGYSKACPALSCDQEWTSNGFDLIESPRQINGKKVDGKKVNARGKVLSDNAAHYSRQLKVNGTVYEGTALVLEAEVDSCTAGHNYELAEKLHHAKLEYVGGFLGGVPIQETVEIGHDGYPQRILRLPDKPFINGGSFKLTIKGY